MARNAKPKLKIETGTHLGRMIVGDYVRNVQQHELFLETPISYLQQGKLRECTCSCGVHRLFAESILASGRIQSCGCLRQEINTRSSARAVKRLQIKAAKTNIISNIHIEQARLRHLKMQAVPIRDEDAIQACASKIRSLIQQKTQITKQLQVATGLRKE